MNPADVPPAPGADSSATIPSWLHPVLSCTDAMELEERLLGGEEAVWGAMQEAGALVAAAVLADVGEVRPWPEDAAILVLAGRGHNGGDALIAARHLLAAAPAGTVAVAFSAPEPRLRPLTLRAWRELLEAGGDRVTACPQRAGTGLPAGPFAVCIDGLLGARFRLPLEGGCAALIRSANLHPAIEWRAAVDLPSGLGGETCDMAFRADATYATGVFKSPLAADAALPWAGRRRYLDMGFFDGRPPGAAATDLVVAPDFRRVLRQPRPAMADKRAQGHVFILAGSRGMPGAALLAAEAALRSGAGLVTVFIPESAAQAGVARLPEAMWVPWPETPGGGLALEGRHLFSGRLPRAGAIIAGPGMGMEPETRVLIAEVLGMARVPVLLDADALVPEVIAGLAPQPARPLVLTPHAGEFRRLAGCAASTDALRDWCASTGYTVVLKGPLTRVGSGGTVVHVPHGGPVLARGGSGDLLSGIIGALLAAGRQPLEAAALGAAWHGGAGDLLARARGAAAVRTTEVLDCLGAAARGARP